MTPIDNCSICIEPLDRAVALNCTHRLHLSCLGQLMHGRPSCPLCRARITSVNGIDLPVLNSTMTENEHERAFQNAVGQNDLSRIIALTAQRPLSARAQTRVMYRALRGAPQIIEMLFIEMSSTDRGYALTNAIGNGREDLLPILMKIEPINRLAIIHVARQNPRLAKIMFAESSPRNRGLALIPALIYPELLQLIVESGPIPEHHLHRARIGNEMHPHICAILDRATVVQSTVA